MTNPGGWSRAPGGDHSNRQAVRSVCGIARFNRDGGRPIRAPRGASPGPPSAGGAIVRGSSAAPVAWDVPPERRRVPSGIRCPRACSDHGTPSDVSAPLRSGCCRRSTLTLYPGGHRPDQCRRGRPRGGVLACLYPHRRGCCSPFRGAAATGGSGAKPPRPRDRPRPPRVRLPLALLGARRGGAGAVARSRGPPSTAARPPPGPPPPPLPMPPATREPRTTV